MSFCVSFCSVAPFAPLLKYTCYMCNRQGAHKSDRISSSLCSHDNALLYLYWYLHFMLIWPWCILSYVWWEAIKLFWILKILNLEILNLESHDDVIKWKHIPRYWPFVRGIHRSPVNSPHKGQWRGALMFLWSAPWINGWVNNREAGDLRRHRAHYDVIVMFQEYLTYEA